MLTLEKFEEAYDLYSDIEIPLAFVLADMEITGMPVPLKSFKASMALSIACWGRTQGPAVKL